jgi:hypothetical protein
MIEDDVNERKRVGVVASETMVMRREGTER